MLNDMSQVLIEIPFLADLFYAEFSFAKKHNIKPSIHHNGAVQPPIIFGFYFQVIQLISALKLEFKGNSIYRA